MKSKVINNALRRFFLFNKVLILLAFIVAGCDKDPVIADDEPFNETTQKASSLSVKLNIYGVSAEVSQLPNIAENAIDEDMATRWSGEGEQVDFIIDLGGTQLIDYVKIAFYNGDIRYSYFEVWTQENSTSDWVKVGTKTSSGTTEDFEVFDVSNSNGKFVMLRCKGNSINDWNSISELEIWGTQLEIPDVVSYSAPYDIPRFQDAISQCKLQAPTSTTIATAEELMAGYTSEYFYVADDDKMAFFQVGDSKRTELRFLENYYVTGGNRSAHASLKFIQQEGNEVTFMQIHDDANADDGPNKPLLRMVKLLEDGHIHAVIKEDDGGVNTMSVDCGAAPSGYFDCDIALTNGYLIIAVDGVEKVNKDVSYWGYQSYWKAGVYNQDSGNTIIYFDELTWN